MRFFERRRSNAATLGATVGMCFALPAMAWTLNFDPPRRVGGDTLSLKINYSGCPATLDTMLDEAVGVWNSVPGSYLKLEKTGTTTATGADVVSGSAGGFVVVCDTTYSADTGADPNVTLATTISSFDQTGYLVRGGVVLNMQSSMFRNETLNQQILVLTHEVGHILGLGHSSDPRAIMYFQVRASGSRPTISQDDVDGVSYLYPRDETSGAQGKLFGCGHLESAAGPGSGGNGPTAGALAAACVLGLIWLGCQSLKHRRF